MDGHKALYLKFGEKKKSRLPRSGDRGGKIFISVSNIYLVSCDGLCVVGLPHNEGGRGVEHLRHQDDGRAWGSHHISHQNGCSSRTLDLVSFDGSNITIYVPEL